MCGKSQFVHKKKGGCGQDRLPSRSLYELKSSNINDNETKQNEASILAHFVISKQNELGLFQN
jgi:hypothetical protein